MCECAWAQLEFLWNVLVVFRFATSSRNNVKASQNFQWSYHTPGIILAVSATHYDAGIPGENKAHIRKCKIQGNKFKNLHTTADTPPTQKKPTHGHNNTQR